MNYTYLIKNLKNFFLIIKNIIIFNNKNPKFIFFSEGISYQKYSILLIESLFKKHPNDIYYVSVDEKDKIDFLKNRNLFIGNGLLMQFFFYIVKSQNLFLTLTDLDNNLIKKNKNVKNYIYFFHAPASTTKIYTETAFDNYDMVFCNGNYQINEIKNRETKIGLKSKILINSGYFYFDFLKNKTNFNVKPDEILIAPSWNINKTNFINENFENIINFLLKKNFKVKFRPHPETQKRSQEYLNFLKDKFHQKNFYYDDNYENHQSMEKAMCLITDTSGIAIEYSLVLERPVIYFDDFDKIHNIKFNEYSNIKTIDDTVKKEFGYTFKKNEINFLDKIINNALIEFPKKKKKINDFINYNFFNFTKTIENFEKNIEKEL